MVFEGIFFTNSLTLVVQEPDKQVKFLEKLLTLSGHMINLIQLYRNICLNVPSNKVTRLHCIFQSVKKLETFDV